MVTPTPSWNTVRVHGTWLNFDGSMKAGTYKVTMPVRVTNATDDVIIPKGVFASGPLNTTPGLPSLDVQVLASDDPDNAPSGFQPIIEITFLDAPGELYALDIPVALSGNANGINLRQVVLAQSLPIPAAVLIRGVAGGLAELDAQGDVINAAGVKITGGGGGGAVASVAGKTGVVTLVKGDVGLANVDNTADTAKPVSTAQATAIGAKADTSALTAHTGNTANPHATTKAQVGLGNVDNTSDANKPVSTAQAAADTAAIAAAATDATSRVATETTRATAAELALRNLSDSAFSTALGARIATVVASNQPPVQVLLPGVAAVATNVVPPGIRMVGATTLDTVIMRAGTVPTGASLVLMIRKNGAALQSVSLPAGQSSVTVTGLAAGVVAGDVLTFDITGVGSTVAGADLALDIIPNPAAVADTPLGLSGIAGRWRADSLTGLVADGALVSAWADKSGLNRNLTGAATRQPTMVANAINGQPAVRFTNTGSAKYMTASGFTVPQPFTQVIIAKTADTSVDSCLIGSFSGGQADSKIAFTRATLNAPTTAASNPVLANNTWYGIYGGFSGAASIHRVYPLSTQATVSPGTNGMNGVTVGNNAFQSSVEGDFHIAEAFIFDHVLTTAEQTTMNTYINTRYGI